MGDRKPFEALGPRGPEARWTSTVMTHRGPRRVTVVIPAWDAYVGFVPRAVASVRDQDLPVRVVIVDNASAAKVPAIDDCELIRSEQRLSRGEIRNVGLAAVETEYVMFFDADDVLLAGAPVRLVRRLDRRPLSLAAVGRILEPSGRFHRTPRPVSAFLARRPRAFAWINAVWSLFSTQGCTIMRTAAVRQAGGYADTSDAEDWALGASLAFQGPIAFDPEPALIYQLRPNSVDRSTRQLLANATLIRNRLRNDGSAQIAPWQLAVLSVAQVLAVLLCRPIVRASRSAFALTRRRARITGDPVP
jgi:cellulose synthase/poly-beta-1,6-N-acetylglucosamine synthase-like glycosyltransferase